MVKKYENDCVACPDGQPCMGNSCPNRNVKHLYCDECKNEVEKLYIVGNEELCEECLLKMFDEINL